MGNVGARIRIIRMCDDISGPALSILTFLLI